MQRATPVTNLDIRRDVLETRAIVSEVRRDVNEMQYILTSRDGDGGKNYAVSDVPVLQHYQTDSDDCLDSSQVRKRRPYGVYGLNFPPVY